MTSQIALPDQIAAPRAALYIIAGMATLGLNDNFIPHIAPDGSLWQFHLLRGTLAQPVSGRVDADLFRLSGHPADRDRRVRSPYTSIRC